MSTIVFKIPGLTAPDTFPRLRDHAERTPEEVAADELREEKRQHGARTHELLAELLRPSYHALAPDVRADLLQRCRAAVRELDRMAVRLAALDGRPAPGMLPLPENPVPPSTPDGGTDWAMLAARDLHLNYEEFPLESVAADTLRPLLALPPEEAAARLVDEHRIGTWSQFCDESDYESASVPDVARLLRPFLAAAAEA